MIVIIGALVSISSSESIISSIDSCTSAPTNSTLNPKSSANIWIVSASILWLILIIIPSPIQVVTISFTETFIILASSLAVANSAILIVWMEAAFCEVSSAAISLWACLLSLLFFTDDVFPTPCNLARVSLTLFCASSAEISKVVFLGLVSFLNFFGSTFSFTILILFFFSSFCGFLNWFKSIFSPVVVTPLSLSAIAFINSESLFWLILVFTSTFFTSKSTLPIIFGVFSDFSSLLSLSVFFSASNLIFSDSILAFSSISCCLIISSALANSFSLANNSADNFAFFSESNSPNKSI